MQNNEKNYDRAESEETKKNKKNNIQKQKKNLVRDHLFMTSIKILNFGSTFFPSTYKHPLLV